MLRLLLPVLLLAFLQGDRSPASVGDELLQADRGFAAAAAGKDTITALSAMFAADITAGVPGGKFVDSRSGLIEALKANPDNATSQVDWMPVRVGVSADGLHGFSFGYMTTRKADGTQTPWKYLAYWIK